MYLWLPKEKETQEETEIASKGNRFAVLAAESEQVFQTVGVRRVSPPEDDQHVEEAKEGDKMEEEFRRVSGESSEEVVKRQR